MSKFRYCHECEDYELHDVKGHHCDPEGFAERLFFDVITIGMSELGRDKYYVCQVCGEKTKG